MEGSHGSQCLPDYHAYYSQVKPMFLPFLSGSKIDGVIVWKYRQAFLMNDARRDNFVLSFNYYCLVP